MKWTQISDSYPPLGIPVLMGTDEKTMPGLYMFGNESVVTSTINQYGWTCWAEIELPNQ